MNATLPIECAVYLERAEHAVRIARRLTDAGHDVRDIHVPHNGSNPRVMIAASSRTSAFDSAPIKIFGAQHLRQMATVIDGVTVTWLERGH